jgi:hypothetical protein
VLVGDLGSFGHRDREESVHPPAQPVGCLPQCVDELNAEAEAWLCVGVLGPIGQAEFCPAKVKGPDWMILCLTRSKVIHGHGDLRSLDDEDSFGRLVARQINQEQRPDEATLTGHERVRSVNVRQSETCSADKWGGVLASTGWKQVHLGSAFWMRIEPAFAGFAVALVVPEDAVPAETARAKIIIAIYATRRRRFVTDVVTGVNGVDAGVFYARFESGISDTRVGDWRLGIVANASRARRDEEREG